MTRPFQAARRACAVGLIATVAGAGVLATPLAAVAAPDGAPTVHSVNDAATLTGAILQLNTAPDADGDVIRFTNTSATTIQLGGDLLPISASAPQFVTVEGAVDGAGTPLVTIASAGRAGFIINNSNGGALTVSDLRFAGVESAISTSGAGSIDTTVSGVTVEGATGIALKYLSSGGSLNVSDSSFTDSESGGGLLADVLQAPGGPARSITLSNVDASRNAQVGVIAVATAPAAGGSSIHTENVTASDNGAFGVIAVVNDHATAEFTGTTAVGNQVASLALETSSANAATTIDGATLTDSGQGLVVMSRNGAKVAVSNTDIARNTEAGIQYTGSNGGRFELLDSVVHEHAVDPEAPPAVSISFGSTPGSALVQNVSVLDNERESGALNISCEAGGEAVIANSTIARNTVATGSAASVSGCDTAQLVSSTVVDNDATGLNASAESVSVLNSILAGNTAGDLATGETESATINHTLVQDSDASVDPALAAGAGNIVDGAAPALDELAYNGGPELGSDGLAFKTLVPTAGSSVIDAGDNAFVPNWLPRDQRAAQRVQGAAVDLGAVETTPPAPPVTPVDPPVTPPTNPPTTPVTPEPTPETPGTPVTPAPPTDPGTTPEASAGGTQPLASTGSPEPLAAVAGGLALLLAGGIGLVAMSRARTRRDAPRG